MQTICKTTSCFGFFRHALEVGIASTAVGPRDLGPFLAAKSWEPGQSCQGAQQSPDDVEAKVFVGRVFERRFG